jgi:DNA-binding phage protein
MSYASTLASPISKEQNTARLYSRKLDNRLRAVMSHTIRYAFKGETRLAQDAGVSRSALNRLINGQSSPSFVLVCALAEALSKRLKRRIEPCELVSCDSTYPTRYVCVLSGCTGCLPGEAYDEEGNLRSEYSHIKPGQWSTQDFPALGESEVE